MRDVIVIGAGGGGAVAAKELAARGLDVLVLEAGPRFLDSERAFAPTDFASLQLFFPSSVSDGRHRAVRSQVEGVGGTTLHYYGNSPRAMPGVFRGGGSQRSDLFPFSYRELIPYYEWVEATLPVQTAPMDSKSEIFLEAAQAVGLPLQTSRNISGPAFRPQENAILQPEGNAGKRTVLRNLDLDNPLRFPEARGCTFCGYCQLGCAEPFGAPRNLKAKRSTDNSYIPMALTADRWTSGRRIELRTEVRVSRILWERRGLGGGRVRGVEWLDADSGEPQIEEARVVVLAAGALESPRLWLNSRLPNPNGWVGRGYTDHYFDVVLGQLDRPTGAAKGPGSNARADFPGAGSLQVVGFGSGNVAGVMAGSELGFLDDSGEGRVVGPELKSMLADIDRLFAIAVLTDDPVDPLNRISTSRLIQDATGPGLKIEVMRRSPRARARRRTLVDKAREMLSAAGARRVVRIGKAPVTVHPMSSLRMGERAATSVLRETGEARWVGGLFVADNAALANALGGPNPTLSTQALATRTAERIFSDSFGGDPWVVSGDGLVPSTDDRVTDAVLAGGL